MSYNSLQIYGISIGAGNTRATSISITSGESRVFGILLQANNYFQGDIIVIDSDNAYISGASVSIVSTTSPLTNLSGTTNSDGIYTVTGIPVVNTTLTIEATGYNTHTGPLQVNTSGDPSMTIILSTVSAAASKKIYVTNKGNVMLNPNDTTLIELS